MNQIIENYIQFVQETIEKYKQNVDLVGNGYLTPDMINEALANYSAVLFSLTAEYQRIKAQTYEKRLQFDSWWDEKFVETRRELNDTSLPASKWLSKQEIESEVRYRYKEEYQEWKRSLFELEHKESFYRQMLDNWKKIDNILTNLSLNMRSELKSLSLEDRANSKLNGVDKAQSFVPPKRRRSVVSEEE
jgi:hypothetical protein